MSRIRPLLLLALALPLWVSSGRTEVVSPGPAPVTSPASGGTWIMGYAVGYERDLLPADELNWSALTHLVVGRATPNADGTLNTTFDIDASGGPLWAKAMVRQAHAHHVRAILMLGGAGEHAGFAGAAARRRDTLVQNILQVVEDYGFDGVDLDWEPLFAADEVPLRGLATRLRQRRPGLLLTLPVAFVNANAPTQEARPSLAALSGTFDRINIMSYGMAGAYPGWQAWHSSALAGEAGGTPTSVQSSVRAYLRAGIPAQKLGLGIGLYGLCYQGVTAPAQSAPSMTTVADDGDMSYVNIVRQYFTAGASRWDARAKVPYLSSVKPLGPHACTYVSYENAASIGRKGQYARSLGLGSVILWTLGQGHFKGEPSGSVDPLLTAAHAAFRP